MSQNPEFHPDENPYASPMLESEVVESGISDDSKKEQWRAFIGSKSDYYLNQWSKLLKFSQYGRDPGFNWAAFLLSGFWLPHRKMYLITFIFYGLIVLISIFEEILFVAILREMEVPTVVDRFTSFVPSIICGLFANRWYYRHAKNKISKVKETCFQSDDLLPQLEKNGGTNLLASVGFFLLFIAMMFITFIVLEIALYPEDFFLE